MLTEQDKARLTELIVVMMAIADTLKELGSAPSGHCYAAVMDKVSLDTYNAIIQKLKDSGKVVEHHHLLIWVGPR